MNEITQYFKYLGIIYEGVQRVDSEKKKDVKLKLNLSNIAKKLNNILIKPTNEKSVHKNNKNNTSSDI